MPAHNATLEFLGKETIFDDENQRQSFFLQVLLVDSWGIYKLTSLILTLIQ